MLEEEKVYIWFNVGLPLQSVFDVMKYYDLLNLSVAFEETLRDKNFWNRSDLKTVPFSDSLLITSHEDEEEKIEIFRIREPELLKILEKHTVNALTNWKAVIDDLKRCGVKVYEGRRLT